MNMSTTPPTSVTISGGPSVNRATENSKLSTWEIIGIVFAVVLFSIAIAIKVRGYAKKHGWACWNGKHLLFIDFFTQLLGALCIGPSSYSVSWAQRIRFHLKR